APSRRETARRARSRRRIAAWMRTCSTWAPPEVGMLFGTRNLTATGAGRVVRSRFGAAGLGACPSPGRLLVARGDRMLGQGRLAGGNRRPAARQAAGREVVRVARQDDVLGEGGVPRKASVRIRQPVLHQPDRNVQAQRLPADGVDEPRLEEGLV